MPRLIVQEDLKKVTEILQTLFKTDYVQIDRLGGLTNHTYHVLTKKQQDLVVRIPGEGTEELISRKDEKVSTELACSLEIDTKLLFFGNDGVKVTKYIDDAVTLSADELRKESNVKKVARIFYKLHHSGVDTGVLFEVFDMAEGYEEFIKDRNVAVYQDYNAVKNTVFKIKGLIDDTGQISKVPCHNDPLCENWVSSGERLFLIDWEYAGMNDGMWDLADISIEANYNDEKDKLLLEEYFGRPVDVNEKKRFIANKIYLDYLWTLWGLTRVPFDGKEMQEYADERYLRLKGNIKKFEKENI